MKQHTICITSVIDYIEENLNETLTLQTVAVASHYSKYHLHRVFTKTVGMTLHDYIQRRRLSEAAKLLIFSSASIIEIALFAGYESQQAFTKTFKQMYKKSPHQYRDANVYYPLQLRYILNKQPKKFNDAHELQHQITYALASDIATWMHFLYLVVDGFPYLDERAYHKQLVHHILHKQAMLLKDNTTIIGAMVFQKETGNIEFLGIHPQYCKQTIAKVFLLKLYEEVYPNTTLRITTFREGDKADIGYRKALLQLGFTQAELLIEFGYPTQVFILKKNLLK